VPGQPVYRIAHRAKHPDERSGLRIKLHQRALLGTWTAGKCIEASSGCTQKNGLAGRLVLCGSSDACRQDHHAYDEGSCRESAEGFHILKLLKTWVSLSTWANT